jgi:hypothetical protein
MSDGKWRRDLIGLAEREGLHSVSAERREGSGHYQIKGTDRAGRMVSFPASSTPSAKRQAIHAIRSACRRAMRAAANLTTPIA